MKETGIIWTEQTWNPVTGCKEVSKGCRFCYAKTIAEKFSGKAFPNGFDLTLREKRLYEPLSNKKPTLYFVNSMSDLFWDEIPIDYLHKIIDVMEQSPWHEFQVLTKRPERMLAFSKERKLPPNFWAGTTIENNHSLRRLDIIKQVKAEIKFISYEPLIERLSKHSLCDINWAITGGESGTHLTNNEIAHERALVEYSPNGKAGEKWKVRKDRIDWIRDIRDACIESGTKFFHKQWGGIKPESAGRMLDGRTWEEMPRLPKGKVENENSYLKKLKQKSDAQTSMPSLQLFP